MKKILCIIDTLGFGGGAERQMSGLAGLLHNKKYNVTLAVYYPHDYDDYLETEYGIRSVLIEVNNNPVSKLIAVGNFIRKGQFDVVIAYKNGTTRLCSLLKLFGFKFQLIVSERSSTTSLNIREKIKFLLYRNADYIVPNSESQANFIKKNFPILINKVRVISNFTDTQYFRPAKKEERRDSVTINIVARIDSVKNVLGFIEAVRVLKLKGIHVSFNWYGSVYKGQEKYAAECESRYKEYELEDMMTFHPAIKDVVIAYQTCDFFCLPSFYEGYPNAICEAMSCGKPILCSRVCDNPFIVKDDINGFLFDPKNSNDMVDKISKICMLPSERIKEIGERNREYAENSFSTETFVQKYIQLIES